MTQLIIGSTALQGVGKQGIIKPDENGWYDMYIGALEFPNSFGATYDTDAFQRILTTDSIFIRRIRQGRLFGELGHPRREPGMDDRAYAARLLDINEKYESHTIKSVSIDFDAKDKHGRRFVAIRALVKPSGPYGHVLERKLQDPDINVNFSLRAFSDDVYVKGKLVRYLKTLVTFDAVGEPGINVADKYNAPSLESALSVTPDDLKYIRDNAKRYTMESGSLVAACNEAIATTRSLIRRPKLDSLAVGIPSYALR